MSRHLCFNSEMDGKENLENSRPMKTLLKIRRKKMDGIKNSFDAVKTAALHSITNNIGKPSTSGDLDGRANHSPEVVPKYDPQLLMFRRAVFSEDVTKSRLCLRDENTQISFDRTNIEAEEDETFFENLKKRISNDIKNKCFNTIETPKRSSTLKKRKNAFNNETLNLMKKCRTRNLGRLENSPSSSDNGIFSLENMGNTENQENIVNKSESFLLRKKSAAQISIRRNENIPDNSRNCEEDDDDLRCATPPGVKCVNYEPETE